MKRIDLIRHLQQHGCQLLREARSTASISIRSTIGHRPSHGNREINNSLARKICRGLEIPDP
jgi:hypothetical protein